MLGTSALNWANVFYYIFYALSGVLVLFVLYLSIQAFRAKISWGQARYMGIPFAAFLWIQGAFYLALFDGAYGVISFIFRLPFWLDLTLVILTIGLVWGLYFWLTKRAKFNKRLFIPLVMIPLGIPGGHLVADLAQVGAIEIVQVGAVARIAKGDLFALNNSLESTTDDLLDVAGSHPAEVPRISRATVLGIIDFANTHTIGRLGDYITLRRLTGMGYTKLPSKYSSIHGIDGVYVKYIHKPSRLISDLIIVENKVGSAKLSINQMSDTWIDNAVTQLLESSDLKSRDTGELLRETIEHNPQIISKQLWHHNLLEGKTTVSILDKNGKISTAWSIWTDKHIENVLRQFCALPKLSTCFIQ